MKKSVIEISGKICCLYTEDNPEYVIIQPTGSHEHDKLDDEAAMIHRNTGRGVCFAAYPIGDWERELSPWAAKQAFGDVYFGEDAKRTLDAISGILIPELHRQSGIPLHVKYILGGYSLAGLFSLWSAYQTDLFYAIAACSPSVWIDGWQEYAEHRVPLTQCVYLSLGNKEHKTRNPMLKTVKQAVLHQYELMQRLGIHTALEWNNGNHFQNYMERMGKAFLWTMQSDEKDGVPV